MILIILEGNVVEGVYEKREDSGMIAVLNLDSFAQGYEAVEFYDGPESFKEIPPEYKKILRKNGVFMSLIGGSI